MRFFYRPENNKHIISDKRLLGGCYEITSQSYFKSMHPNLYPYDIECYPNVFTVTVYRPSDEAIWRFEVSDRINNGVDFFQLLTSIKNSNGKMAGFNNVGYDYPVIHELILRGGHITASELYSKSMAIIDGDSFDHMVWESDRYVPQIDLFKIHHFDNKARSTSLKMLEFNMRSKNIQDLPFPPGIPLTNNQIDVLIRYNDHDVFETSKFLEQSLEMIEFRDELSAKYGRDFTNHNDGKIGSDYFVMELEKRLIPCYYHQDGRRHPIQTVRLSIALNEVIIPWIQFQQPEFQQVIEWLKEQTITQTKGCFEFIEVTPKMAMSMNPNRIKVHGLTHNDIKATDNQLKKGILLSKCLPDLQFMKNWNQLKFISGWKKKSGLNCIIDGFLYDFGTGGIHGSIESQIVSSDRDYLIIDLDVKSYYTNLATSNRFHPEHLGEQFCDIYEEIYNQRLLYDKGTMQNKALKYALNVPYGQSNSQYSPFYDSAYTMTITINGQLLLCLLAEYLGTIPNLSMIQINTDGLSVRCPRDQIDNLTFIAKTWEQITGLELDRNDYNRMIIRDVNNYIAEGADGELKRKGTYCYGGDLDWSKNHSCQIVAIAAEAALVRGQSIKQTIMEHSEIMDFMLCTKVPRNSRLMLDDRQLQNITRYYVSNQGGSLIKVMPPTSAQVAKDPNAPERLIGIEVDWKVTPCNNMDSILVPPDGGCGMDINYDYYIQEAEKLVNPLIEGTQL